MIIHEGIGALAAGSLAAAGAVSATRLYGASRAFAVFLTLCGAFEVVCLAIMQAVYAGYLGGWPGALVMFSTWGLWMTAHIPSMAALGMDEIVERHGVVISTLGHLADLLLWASLMTLVYRQVERAGGIEGSRLQRFSTSCAPILTARPRHRPGPVPPW